MRFFGNITASGVDMVNKEYVDSGGYSIVSTVVNIPVNRRNIIAVLSGQEYTLSLSQDLQVGGELWIHMRTTNTSGCSVGIPSMFNEFPISYGGSYDSQSGPMSVLLTYSEISERISSMDSCTLRIFFDGAVYYIDKLSK